MNVSVAMGVLKGKEQGWVLNIEPECTGGKSSACASTTSCFYDGIWICAEWKLSPKAGAWLISYGLL